MALKNLLKVSVAVRASIVAATLASLTACGEDIGSDAGFASEVEQACGGACIRKQGPELLSYDELTALTSIPGAQVGNVYQLKGGDKALQTKLNKLLSEPFISNEAYYAGVQAHRPKDAELGTVIKAGIWNIERGQELPLIEETFTAANDLSARANFLSTRVRAKAVDTPEERDELERQLDELGQLDVIVLNELDIGMKRSGYAPVAERLAGHLGMNYAYAVEFVEVDPVLLGTEKFVREDFLPADGATGATLDDGSVPDSELNTLASEANTITQVDPSRTHNTHGNAILSRYPIVSVKQVRLQPRKGCWDWNANERTPKDIAGRGMDYLAERIFLQKTMRELRHGGRVLMMADIYVPGISAKGTTMEFVPGERENIVTVVNVHLEAKSTPECRREQMKEVLGYIKDIKNPVIMAGDLNTLGGDGRPMTVERLLFARFKDPNWISRQIAGRLIPYAGWAYTARDIINWIRVKDDPTGVNIPLLLPNPEKGLFSAVEDFSFADGGRFDFRGDESRTVNETAKTLANSNQRDDKGFKTSFSFVRPIGIGDFTIVGRFKLDWMFVRGYARSPRDKRASFRMAPHFPSTLEELRDATSPRLSDHAPMTVLLPLADPCPEKSCATDPDGALEFGDETWEQAYGE